jgi:hypothetical protein
MIGTGILVIFISIRDENLFFSRTFFFGIMTLKVQTVNNSTAGCNVNICNSVMNTVFSGIALICI